MKYLTRLSDAVHILAFIALYPDCDLTSNKLAESIQTNPACGVGVNIQLVLRDFYLDIQKTAEQKMQEITLKDVLEQYHMKLEGMLLQRL